MEHELAITAFFNTSLPGVANAILAWFGLHAENPARPWANYMTMQILVALIVIVLFAILRPRLTVGTDPATAEKITAMGAEHHNVGPSDVFVDEDNKLVSTPCYMNDVGPWTVYQGAEKLVEEVLRMAGDMASIVRGHMATPMPSGT